MENDLDRYRQLLGDWEKKAHEDTSRPSPVDERPEPIVQVNRTGARKTPLSSGASPQSAPPRAASGEREAPFERGTLLVLDEADLLVYRRPVAGKPLDMVYSLLADGSVKIDAISLEGANVVELGMLSDTDFRTLQGDMIWTRDLVARSCFSPDDGERIPEPVGTPQRAPRSTGGANPSGGGEELSGNGQQERYSIDPKASGLDDYIQQESAGRVKDEDLGPEVQPAAGKGTIRRGQKLTIQMGAQNWEAVYWGRDQRGSVVVHRTQNTWTLVHLDLANYRDTMKLSPDVDPALVGEINRELAAQQAKKA